MEKIHYKIITKLKPIFGPKLETLVLTKWQLFTTQMLAILQLHFNQLINSYLL